MEPSELIFWGTCGGVARSGTGQSLPGNTLCLSISQGDDTLVIDGGTGLRDLGLHLGKRRPGHQGLVITAYTWDHIQGLPFFGPLFAAGGTVDVWGIPPAQGTVEEAVRAQMQSPFFPVTLEQLPADVQFRILAGEPARVGEFSVATFSGSGLVVRVDGATVVYGNSQMDLHHVRRAGASLHVICNLERTDGPVQIGALASHLAQLGGGVLYLNQALPMVPAERLEHMIDAAATHAVVAQIARDGKRVAL